MNYKFIVAYKGTNYSGWAIQENKRTIQGVLKEIFKQLFSLDVCIIGSGRTDKGVHAYGQVFNVKHEKLNYDPLVLMKALNSQLPNDIEILDAQWVSEQFHARFSALRKTYVYKINCDEKGDLFLNDLIYQYNQPIDLKKLEALVPVFLGTHDFLSFSTSEVENTVRTIFKIEFNLEDHLLLISITGDGFLRNMVRMLVATFLAFNENKVSIDEIQAMLDHPKKGQAVLKAPACGLYLLSVKYD